MGINIFNASDSELNSVKIEVLNNLPKRITKKIREKYVKTLDWLFNEALNTYIDKVKDVLSKCGEDNIKIITPNGKDYPEQFKKIYDFPFVIYFYFSKLKSLRNFKFYFFICIYFYRILKFFFFKIIKVC